MTKNFSLSSLKRNGIILSREGPYDNILKFKPPMCFDKDDANFLVEKLSEALTEIEQKTNH